MIMGQWAKYRALSLAGSSLVAVDPSHRSCIYARFHQGVIHGLHCIMQSFAGLHQSSMPGALHVKAFTGATVSKACAAGASELQTQCSAHHMLTSPHLWYVTGHHGSYLSRTPCSWWCKHQALQHVLRAGTAERQTLVGCPPA